ncbi:MAG TPA: signal peptidase II [Anaerolineae bacterium]|jgi:signal peptidase II|nr:signal peptidase II [Anaerolineae bacterium]
MNRSNLLKLVRDYTGLLVFVSAVIGLDQWTKWLVRENIPFMGIWLPEGLEWLAPYARIVHWYNTGAAFGMFQGYGWIFATLAFVVAGMIIFYYPRTDPADWWLRLAMGMQMAGALGNVIDRLTLDWKVTDFISVGTFPVFNIADASISVGVVILLVGVWWKESREKRLASEQELSAEETNSDETSTGAMSVQVDEAAG